MVKVLIYISMFIFSTPVLMRQLRLQLKTCYTAKVYITCCSIVILGIFMFNLQEYTLRVSSNANSKLGFKYQRVACYGT